MEKSIDSASKPSMMDIKAYLKDNLKIVISADSGKLEVRLELENEEIASDCVHVCDIVNEKDNW